MARFLLRDGKRISAEVSHDRFDVFSYENKEGSQVHAIACVESEKALLGHITTKVHPLTPQRSKASTTPIAS